MSYPFGPVDESDTPDTSLYYMLQLPSSPQLREEDSDGDNEDTQPPEPPKEEQEDNRTCQALHLLPDGLTVKCNLEIRVDTAILHSLVEQWRARVGQLNLCCQEVEDEEKWRGVVDTLSAMEEMGARLHYDWLQLPFQ